MSKDEQTDKPEEVKQAEQTGGETFDPTVEQPSEQTRDELVAAGKCPDCNGLGIRDPQATQVCSTCAGTGKA